MKCPSCSAVIDGSYVESLGSPNSVSCPACGFMLATGSHDLFSTATEFKAVSGWTIRLAKGQEVHFESQSAFGEWLKQTTITPGDMICKDGVNWEGLGTYLLGQRGASNRDSQAYQVPPTTLDAPDPEDEFEELDNVLGELDARADTSHPVHMHQITSPSVPILATAVGHERRIPPPIPGGSMPASEPEHFANGGDDETITIAAVTDDELLRPNQALIKEPSVAEPPVPPRAVSPAHERQSHPAPPKSSTHQPVPVSQGNGGFGKVLLGLVVGALLASLAGIDLMATDEGASSAQRVVVTKQVAELSLKDRELLETSERWSSYLSLSSTTALQLKSRLDLSKETTARGRLQRQALLLAAYAFDLHRTKDSNERKQVLATYDEYITRGNAGTMTNAFELLKTSSRREDMKHAAEPKPLLDTEAKGSQSGGSPERKEDKEQPAEGLDASSVVSNQTAVEKDAGTKPNAPVEKAKPISKAKEKSSGKAAKTSYSKMLREGTRHLENGRLKDASLALKKAAKIKPKAHAPQFKLGYVALNRGDLSQALRYFKRARDLKPRDRETLLGLGSVYEKMGRRDDARRVYERYQSYFKGANDRRRIEYKLEKLGR